MVPADRATILHETPIIRRHCVPANEEKAIQLSQIVSRNVETDHGRGASRPPGLHVSPIVCLIKPCRCIEASAKIFKEATDCFIDGLLDAMDMSVRCAVEQLDDLVSPRRHSCEWQCESLS